MANKCPWLQKQHSTLELGWVFLENSFLAVNLSRKVCQEYFETLNPRFLEFTFIKKINTKK
jgi:hypothetical protein